MEGSHDRPSGIPRFSRLPVARPVSGIPKPSLNTPASSPARHAPSATSHSASASPRSHPPLKGRETSIARDEAPSGVASSSLSAQPTATTDSKSRRQTYRGAENKNGTPCLASSASPVSHTSMPQTPPAVTPKSGRLRLSLSERTVETLSLLPSSPSVNKSPAHFFDSSRQGGESNSRTSTPASSHHSEGSPRCCNFHEDRPSPSPSSRLNAPSVAASPPSANAGRGGRPPKYGTLLSRPSIPSAPRKQVAPEAVDSRIGAPLQRGPKTMADRTLKPRISVNGLYKKPSLPALSRAAKDSAMPKGAPLRAKQAPTTAARGTTTTPPLDTGTEHASLKNRKSSAALRDQIAKAKAAKRAAVRDASAGSSPAPAHAGTALHTTGNGYDFDATYNDPFNQRRDDDANIKVLKQRVESARTSGRLNIAALGLKSMPDQVMTMYDLETIGTYDGSWAESVDLTRLVAADNEFETLDDDLFPDVKQDANEVDSDGQTRIFGGLETLDMHGNVLVKLPLGLRCLPYMNSLNLSSNRLDNECLEILAQMTGLRELKVARNQLSGPLSPAISKLESLEILDIHGNDITALPSNFCNMSRLRILNLSDNKLESLSFNNLSIKSLTELSIKKNQLSGVLIQDEIESLPLLQTLDASSNQLTHVVAPGSHISLPAAHTLMLSVNKFQELPDVTTWTSLLTLKMDENNISDFPAGFTRLDKLRHADFAYNDIRMVPPEISRMETLSMFRLTGNPLRDRKLLSTTTEELKEVLAGRLEPPPPYQESGASHMKADLISDMESKASVTDVQDAADVDHQSDMDEDFATPPTSAPHSPVQQARSEVWLIKAGGLLDRSETNMSELSTRMCIEVAAKHSVQQVQLHHNHLTCIPAALHVFAETLTSLSLAHNKLAGQLLLDEGLELPVLREMNLASNQMTSLEELGRVLRAPALSKVDVSLNRITHLPNLKQAFPQLKVLLAANNQLTELTVESISGLGTVNVANNDIAHLNPLIGLLGGKGGLKKLHVSGNRFKVPRWNILERGTDETLRWLRQRVPEADMAAWRAANGDEGDEDECY